MLTMPARAADDGAVESTSPGPTLAAIEHALGQGTITEAEAVLYKLDFVKGSGKLPSQYVAGGERVKCGTEIVMEAQAKKSGFPPAIQSEIEALLVRPTLSDYVDTEHFRIHYNTTGPGAIYGWPNPAYRDSVVSACETSWRFYHRDNNWQTPPSDGIEGGGIDLIDCYVDNLTGVYGYTQSERAASAWSADYTAYFVVDHDYAGFGYANRTLPMKVTVAHEYHHVVQMGYALANGWWMEQVSTFMENEVYPSINDNYQYIPCYMSKPYKSLSFTDNCFPYACFLWPTMLREQHGHDVIRRVEACTAEDPAAIWNCFDRALGTVEADLYRTLAEWAVWNFYTWFRDDGSHYRDASAFHSYMAYDPDVHVSSYPAVDVHPSVTRRPEATGSSVIRLLRDPTTPHNKLTIDYEGPGCTAQVVAITKQVGAPVFREWYVNLDSHGHGSVDVIGWEGMEWAQVIVTMSENCLGPDGQDYVINAVTTRSTGVGDENPPLYTRLVRLDQNTPNPFGPLTTIAYRLETELPVSLSVFDAGGRRVRALISATQAPGEYSARWDGRDDAGRDLGPGVYFYRLDAGGESQVRKMILAE
jgi:hypothetical protein